MTRFRNSPAPFTTKTMYTWRAANYFNWNVNTQLNKQMRLRVAGSSTRNGNRGSIASNLQPNGSVIADGTPTDGFNSATWDTTEEGFKDRWERTGANSK